MIALGDCRVTFSTKADGNMARSLGHEDEVKASRAAFFTKNGINPSRLFLIHPRHSANTAWIKPNSTPHQMFLHAPAIDTDFPHYYDGHDGAFSDEKDFAIG